MRWYGEHLWRGELPSAAGAFTYQVCATDAAGNQGCSAEQTTGSSGDTDGGPALDAATPGGTDGGGGCCGAAPRATPGALLAALVLAALGLRRRRWVTDLAALRRRRRD
jgi:hypothetical protein